MSSHIIFKRLAKALIRLRVCAGWSEALLVAHTTLLDISCRGSYKGMHKVSKGAKIRNRYNQVPHLTQDTNGKVKNLQLDTTNESQEVSPFPAGDHKASKYNNNGLSPKLHQHVFDVFRQIFFLRWCFLSIKVCMRLTPFPKITGYKYLRFSYFGAYNSVSSPKDSHHFLFV